MTEATVATRRVLTTEEKIAKLQARIAKDTAALASLQNAESVAAAFANVKAGDLVTFVLGRAETKRTLSGSVIARGDVDGKDVVKVIAGVGLETAVYQVEVSKLASVGGTPGDQYTDVSQPAPTDPVGDNTETSQLSNEDAHVVDNNEIDDLLSDVSAETEANLNAVQLS